MFGTTTVAAANESEEATQVRLSTSAHRVYGSVKAQYFSKISSRKWLLEGIALAVIDDA